MFLWSLLAAVFGPFVDLTASPVYRTRELGSRVLFACWPASIPAIRQGYRSPDMEVRRRSARADRFSREQYQSIIADLVAVDLVLRKSDCPWLDWEFVWKTSRETPGLHAALARFATAHGLRGDDQFGFDRGNDTGFPFGIDHLRFRWRKMPSGWIDDWKPETVAKINTEFEAYLTANPTQRVKEKTK